MRIGKRQLNHRDDGFTMAELVVAMIIITSVLLVLMAVQTSALVTIADASKRQAATQFANAALEQMRSLPYAVISRGMDADFVTAAGGDPYVAGGLVTIDGVTETLVVANPNGTAGDQDRSNPWPPLYDSTGSNRTVNVSPENPGIEFETRAYVVEGIGGADTYGLTVVVQWTDLTTGIVHHTVQRTTAYAPTGGCADLSSLETQPFLSSCQARFNAASASASISSVTTAELTDADGGGPTAILPGTDFYELRLTTTEARASLSSQQVTAVDATMAYGGESTLNSSGTPFLPATFPRGYEFYVLEASNDTASVGAPGTQNSDNKTKLTATVPSVLSGLDSSLTFRFKSDQRASGEAIATVESACDLTGVQRVPANNPCAQAVIGGGTEAGFRLNHEDTTNRKMYPFLRSDTAGTWDEAWVGRFVDTAGTVACTSLADEGCVAAGAASGSSDFAFGVVEGGNGWTGAPANRAGLVIISGYQDSVLVERGVDQKTAAPTVSRAATLSYWDGSGYVDVSITAGTELTLDETDIPVRQWQGGAMTVDSSVLVTVTGASTASSGSDPDCISELCKVTASNGVIVVSSTFIVVFDNGTISATYELTTSTTLTGSHASAAYQGAPSA